MNYLSKCVCLALAASLPAKGGELTISPSVSLGLFQTKTTGLELGDDFDEIDTVVHAELDTLIEYKAKVYLGSLNYKVGTYKYNHNNDYDFVNPEFTLKNSLSFLNDDLVVSHKWRRHKELIEQLEGSFRDDLYSLDGNIERDDHSSRIDYTIPEKSDLDGDFYLSYQEERFKNESSDELALGFYEKQNLKTAEAGWELNNSKSSRSFYWYTQGEHSLQKRTSNSEFVEDDYLVVTRTPILGGLNLSLKGKYSSYSNSIDWDFGDDDGDVENSTIGTGLSWVKIQNQSYFEITYDRTKDENSETDYSIGVDFKWKFGDRWSLFGNRENRFYGNSYTYGFSYIGERSSLSLERTENVSLRYVPVPTTFNDGVYICDQPSDGEEFDFNQDVCFLPNENNVEILPGQFVYPNTQQYFPVEARLTLEKETTFSWRFTKASWSHQLYVSKVNDEDLASVRVTDGYEGEFNFQYRLDSTSRIEGGYRYQDSEIKNFDFYSKSSIYSVGFHQDINRRSDWSLELRHSSQRGDFGDQNDSRVMLTYTHHFGKKNKRLREL